MDEFILLMHDDTDGAATADEWGRYLADLRAGGAFDGGSSIGDGMALRKNGASGAVSRHITGFLRVRAADIDDARRFLSGNPVFEHGGTVEIRSLPKG